jgi:S1-C subfamily serine protease
VSSVDWIIVGFTLLMALWGYAQGLIVGGLSLVGFAAGAFAGSRLAPLVLTHGSRSPYAPAIALFGALLVGGVLASALEVLGFRLRNRLHSGLGVLDGMGGAVLVACLGLAFAWLAGAVALQTPQVRELRKEIQRSKILDRLNAILPPSGSLLQALARFDPFPQITGPLPGVGPPNAAVARDPDVRAAGASVVRVLGTACGLGVQGSGWVAGDGVVVTNAHVVAGEDDTTVQIRGEGAQYDAQPILFDPHNDVAVLRAPGVSGVRALRLNVAAPSGTSGAVLGFPGNGPYDVEPARLGRTSTIRADDAYGRGPISRRITVLRGHVRSGNSGGPMVDDQGRVLTTLFAASVTNGGRTGYGVPDSVVRDDLAGARGPVGTGPCVR